MPPRPSAARRGVRAVLRGAGASVLSAALLAAAPAAAAAEPPAPDSARAARRAALVAELLDEGAGAEARAEAARLRADEPEAAEAALAPLAPALALEGGSFAGFAEAFRTARDPRVFRVAGCALARAFADDPALAAAHEDLAERVALCEGSWSAKDRADAARLSGAAAAPAARGGIGGWLARRVVGFYRTFVGPALGSRCALEPSCSRYFVHAARKHGLLGVPMTADRFVREPVVSAPDRPWIRNAAGAWRHPDPVEDHDWWFGP